MLLCWLRIIRSTGFSILNDSERNDSECNKNELHSSSEFAAKIPINLIIKLRICDPI